MKKELLIFLGLVVVLAFSWHHKEFLSYPIEHLMRLPHGGAYGIPGVAHPFVFTFLLYVILWIPRLIVRAIVKDDKK